MERVLSTLGKLIGMWKGMPRGLVLGQGGSQRAE